MGTVKPTFWFVAGAATGVYAMVKAKRAVEVFTPDGIAARVAAVRAGARQFAGTVAEGANEREADLLAELRANADGYRLLEQSNEAAPAAAEQTAAFNELGTTARR